MRWCGPNVGGQADDGNSGGRVPRGGNSFARRQRLARHLLGTNRSRGRRRGARAYAICWCLQVSGGRANCGLRNGTGSGALPPPLKG
jgi:hypothetical protein